MKARRTMEDDVHGCHAPMKPSTCSDGFSFIQIEKRECFDEAYESPKASKSGFTRAAMDSHYQDSTAF